MQILRELEIINFTRETDQVCSLFTPRLQMETISFWCVIWVYLGSVLKFNVVSPQKKHFTIFFFTGLQVSTTTSFPDLESVHFGSNSSKQIRIARPSLLTHCWYRKGERFEYCPASCSFASVKCMHSKILTEEVKIISVISTKFDKYSIFNLFPQCNSTIWKEISSQTQSSNRARVRGPRLNGK